MCWVKRSWYEHVVLLSRSWDASAASSHYSHRIGLQSVCGSHYSHYTHYSHYSHYSHRIRLQSVCGRRSATVVCCCMVCTYMVCTYMACSYTWSAPKCTAPTLDMHLLESRSSEVLCMVVTWWSLPSARCQVSSAMCDAGPGAASSEYGAPVMRTTPTVTMIVSKTFHPEDQNGLNGPPKLYMLMSSSKRKMMLNASSKR